MSKEYTPSHENLKSTQDQIVKIAEKIGKDALGSASLRAELRDEHKGITDFEHASARAALDGSGLGHDSDSYGYDIQATTENNTDLRISAKRRLIDGRLEAHVSAHGFDDDIKLGAHIVTAPGGDGIRFNYQASQRGKQAEESYLVSSDGNRDNSSGHYSSEEAHQRARKTAARVLWKTHKLERRDKAMGQKARERRIAAEKVVLDKAADKLLGNL